MRRRSGHLTSQGILSFRESPVNSTPYFRTLALFGNVYLFRYLKETLSSIR